MMRGIARSRGLRRTLLVESLEGRQLLSGASHPAAEVRRAALPAIAIPAGGFVPMFDGKDLNGWVNPYDSGRAYAKNGEVFLAGPKKFFLVSLNTYQNFVLEADVKIPVAGNSGFQFRSRYGHDLVRGYQADVDSTPRNWAGGLWFEGRNWIARPSHPAPVKVGRWNHYVVSAIGNHIQISVNGVTTVDVHSDIDSSGHIALQDHGGEGVYAFRNVMIDDLGG